MAKATEASQSRKVEAAKPYVAPELKLVGNLNDLLAGTGTQNTDNAESCPANTTSFFSENCV